AQGLRDSGIPAAVRIHDWTTGCWPLFLFHLRAWRRNRLQAREGARVGLTYHEEYPGRPVYLLGHSGGPALAVWVLEALHADCTVSAALLLAPALAPDYPLGAALRRTELGIWNFYSPLDLLFLAAGTLLFGTLDGQHRISAGCSGFTEPADLS